MKRTTFVLVFVSLLISLFVVNAFAAGAEDSIIKSVKYIHTLVVTIGCLVCAIGFAVGMTKSAAGDENGKKMAIGAAIAFLLLLLSKPIFNTLIDSTKQGQVQNTEVEKVFK